MIEFILFLALGVAAGLIAGLLGIGGGLVVVPGLAFVLHYEGMPLDEVMHIAAGTSLCIMIFTALASSVSYYRRGHVRFDIALKMLPFILIGTIVGSILANLLHGGWLSILFAVFLGVNGIKLLLPKKPSDTQTAVVSMSTNKAHFLGGLVGIPAGLLGVGGGIFSVPLLLHCNLSIRQAAGTSSALTLPISIVGTLSFMVLGLATVHTPWTTGYIYWPAVLGIAPLSMLFAPVGTKLAEILPVPLLRIIFAILMLLIAAQMLWKLTYS